jgi:hypothetical protein
MHTIFWLENLEGREHLEDPGVDGNLAKIRMYLRETEWEVVNWIHLAQDRDQWRTLMNTVMNLRVP